MVLALLRKAVAARQVAVVGDVQAEGLHHGLPLLEIQHIVLIEICGKKLLAVDEKLYVLQRLVDLGTFISAGELLSHRRLLAL